MMRTLDDILKYGNEALKSIPRDHPYCFEINSLLTQQLKDEVNDTLITRPASKA